MYFSCISHVFYEFPNEKSMYFSCILKNTLFFVMKNQCISHVFLDLAVLAKKNTWEIHEKYMFRQKSSFLLLISYLWGPKIHEKYMRNTWDIHWFFTVLFVIFYRYMRNTWEIHEKYMCFSDICRSLKIHWFCRAIHEKYIENRVL